MKSVYREVRTWFLNKAVCNFVFKGLIRCVEILFN